MSLKKWEEKVLRVDGAAERVVEIERELRLAVTIHVPADWLLGGFGPGWGPGSGGEELLECGEVVDAVFAGGL